MNLFRPSIFKRTLFFIHFDIFIMLLSLVLAYGLRFDFSVDDMYIQGMGISFIFLLLIRVIGFYFIGIYRISWRHFSLNDLVSLVYILLLSSLLLLIVAYILREINIIIPRSIISIEFFIALFLIFGLRISKRVYFENLKKNRGIIATLIVAKADMASNIIKTLKTEHSVHKSVAILDDTNKGIKINGVMTYSYEQLLDKQLFLESAIISERLDSKNVYEKLSKIGITDMKIATLYSDYKTSFKTILVEDLLARKPKDLDKTQIKTFISNKTILITGAGGSIGSELARNCIKFGAKKLILLDHSEYNLYEISKELENENIVTIMQTVTSKILLEKTFKEYNFDIVLHAAAYKHVTLVEENIQAAILNNIIGTKNIVDMAIKYKVDKMVLISTDKAVRPTNVMGTTKRICELYAQNVDSKATQIAAVRFGNVLGSSGSVIPLFKKQIAKGGPVTVTHPEITRYFMLIPEACQLVLQAASIAKGDELFVLDMGEPIKIVDLAQKMIELSGKKIDIIFSGLRPGEKLYEELLIDESDKATVYKSIFVAKQTKYDIKLLENQIEELLICEDKLAKLKEIVPEFEHKI